MLTMDQEQLAARLRNGWTPVALTPPPGDVMLLALLNTGWTATGIWRGAVRQWGLFMPGGLVSEHRLNARVIAWRPIPQTGLEPGRDWRAIEQEPNADGWREQYMAMEDERDALGRQLLQAEDLLARVLTHAETWQGEGQGELLQRSLRGLALEIHAFLSEQEGRA